MPDLSTTPVRSRSRWKIAAILATVGTALLVVGPRERTPIGSVELVPRVASGYASAYVEYSWDGGGLLVSPLNLEFSLALDGHDEARASVIAVTEPRPYQLSSFTTNWRHAEAERTSVERAWTVDDLRNMLARVGADTRRAVIEEQAQELHEMFVVAPEEGLRSQGFRAFTVKDARIEQHERTPGWCIAIALGLWVGAAVLVIRRDRRARPEPIPGS